MKKEKMDGCTFILAILGLPLAIILVPALINFLTHILK